MTKGRNFKLNMKKNTLTACKCNRYYRYTIL